jgi:anaerobic selenocysteine-containing dehydrogenase
MDATFNRRDFLAFGGATLAGITLGETGRRWLARVDERTATPATFAAESWATSVCRECPAACGVRVRLMDRTPVKLEGNPNCPIARGTLCAKGQAALESYFDPDRLVGPARRTGRRGENRWTPITWDAAVSLLASHLDLHAPPDAMIAFAADERGPVDDAWTRFWTILHARTAWTLSSTAERLAPAFAALTGAAADPVFDLERSTQVLSFGAPLVEDWLSPVWAQRAYGRFRRGAGRPRGRLVQVDSRRSLTARKADEWLPVAVDRQVFLAYGIASVLFRENRIDRALLDSLGGNLNDFEGGVVARYTPDNVAVATGIPVVTLLRLARDLTSSAQPLVVVAADAPRDLVDATFALNALIGALDRPGGVFEATMPANERRDGRSAAAALADLASRRDPPSVVALRDASALRALSAPHDPAPDLARCGFVVSFSPYLDEAAAVADLLLPAPTPLESWQGLVPPTADGTEKFACARPAAASRLDTRDVLTVLRMLADTIGGDLPSVCPAASPEAVGAEVERVWRLRRGAPYTSAFETNWVRQLERGGWWVPPTASGTEFADALLSAGGWVDPYREPGQIRQAIARRGGLSFPMPSAPPDSLPAVVAASFDKPDAPVAAGARSSSALRLTCFTPSVVNLGGGPNQPALFELLGQPDSAPWRVWAELHPDTARRLGIVQGTTIRVSSRAASIEVIATLVDRTPPDTIAVAYVPSLSSSGRWARLVAADVRRLRDDDDNGNRPIEVHVAAV